jgi:hypothetical protein
VGFQHIGFIALAVASNPALEEFCQAIKSGKEISD